MNTIIKNTKSTWKEVFTNGDDVVGLNLIHPQVVKLFDINSKDDLTESARKDMISSITDLKLNSIMFQSTFGEMMILHHNTKIGGSLLNPNTEHFGLFGHEKQAIPLKFKPESILKVNEVETPSWATIQNVTTTEDLNAARDANPVLCHFTSAIAIPPFLTKELISMQAPSPADVYMKTLQVFEDFDRDKAESVRDSTAISETILTYLWGVHHNLITPVATSPHVSPQITQSVINSHRENITLPPHPRKPTSKTSQPPPPRLWSR